MHKTSVIRGMSLVELVSIRELAKRLNVSDTTIRKAIKKGRIFGSAIVGSKVDVQLATSQFNKNKDAAKVRKPKTQKAPTIQKKIAKDVNLVPDEEIFANSFNNFDDFEPKASKKRSPYIPDNDDPENELTKQRVRKEKAMADMTELKVLEYEGSLVDVEKATLAIFEVMREQRDHWLRFPDRVAANMAARFGIDKVEYKTALVEEVKKHCKDVGDLKFDLTS